MKVRHYAAILTVLVVLISLAIIAVAQALKENPKPKEIGEFEFEGVKTKVYQAGECQIYASKFKNNENPMFYFSCNTHK